LRAAVILNFSKLAVTIEIAGVIPDGVLAANRAGDIAPDLLQI
jgi:hypothetical protein